MRLEDVLRLKDIRTASEARGPEQLALDPASCSLTFGNCLGPRAALAVLMSFSAWVVTDPAAGNIAEEPKPKAVHRRFLKFPLEYTNRYALAARCPAALLPRYFLITSYNI